MMKTFFFLILVSTLSASFDFDDSCAQLPSVFLPPSKKCSANDTSETSDVYLSFDFLYWEGTEKGLEYALKNTTTAFDQRIQVYEPRFGFNPAFRIGIGTHLDHDNWDVEFFYTRYYTSSTDYANHSFNGNEQSGIRSVWTSSTAFQGNSFRTYWQDSEAKWKLHTHIIDLYLKHDFCISSRISVDPGFGLKFAILQQRYVVQYGSGNTAFDILGNRDSTQFLSSKIAMKNRSFNLGMGAKIDFQWNLFEHFELLGNLSGSLMGSQFEVGRNESDVSSSPLSGIFVESFRQDDEFWTIRPMASVLLGFGWSNCVCRPKNVIYYGINAAYEANLFWKQNMLFRFIDQTNAAMISPSQGDLFLHGLTLKGFIDF